MDTPTLRDYPHLPRLTIDQCLAVFRVAGITFNRLADLLGYSRMAVYHWRKNTRAPLSHSLDRVSTLAYRTLACVRGKTLPLPAGLREARARLERTRAALDAVDLAQADPSHLLPKNWLTKT